MPAAQRASSVIRNCIATNTEEVSLSDEGIVEDANLGVLTESALHTRRLREWLADVADDVHWLRQVTSCSQKLQRLSLIFKKKTDYLCSRILS